MVHIKDESISVGTSVTRLATLLADGSFAATVGVVTIDNKSESANVYISRAGSAPASSAAMSKLEPGASRALPYGAAQAEELYVVADAASTAVHVWQETV